MSKVTLSQLAGISTTLNQTTVPAGHTLAVNGDVHHHSSTGAIKIQSGTTAQRPGSPTPGAFRFNTTEGYAEYYDGSTWQFIAENQIPLGAQTNPAPHGMALKALNYPSGLYWIQVSGQSSYRMYVDNDRNGGGWTLCATVRTSTCQDHMTTSSVRISGSTGPRWNNSSTTKMADSWIQALRNASTYSGSTAYWLEAVDFNKDMFVDTSATVHLEQSASNNNPRTRVSTSYEGGLSDRNPNTGTRGFGDHHTSGGTYFAWGRHPESGNNCGFREDSLGASDGFLWVK